MREVSRHLFIPRRPLIASMLASDPERSWFRIVKASLISSTRPALTSAPAPFAMTRRFPLPARRSFASIDRATGSRSGRWLSPASSAAATFARLSNRLSSGKQTSVKRGGAFIFFHDFCAFVSNAHDGGAGLSPRLLSNDRKYLFQPLNLAFSFAAMFFERSLKLFALGCFRHFRQGREYLLFREINVLQRIVKQRIELLGFLRHFRLSIE